MQIQYLYGILGVGAGFLLAWIIQRLSSGSDRPERIRLTEENAVLRTQLAFQTNLYQQKKTELDELALQLRTDFKLLAQNILDEKSQQFQASQHQQMSGLLEPLKQHLGAFKEQIEKTYKVENDDRISLRAELQQLMKLNHQLSKEAHSLAAALSGNTKKQGDWGELILETILDYCGLQKGVHYQTQLGGIDADGNRIRPDVLVNYPDGRVVIIDSKVSLTHYDALCREEDTGQQAVLLKQLGQSVKLHIDSLSSKQYTQLPGSLDMVIMFLPVEAAYITALQHDPGLQQYAYAKNILLVSPANLVLAIKLIHDLWKKDAINKNADLVAEKAGQLYDKLAGFVHDFQKLGGAINSMQKLYEDAHQKLAAGRGNIVSRAEKMKQLHIRASKRIDSGIANSALLEDEDSAAEEN